MNHVGFNEFSFSMTSTPAGPSIWDRRSHGGGWPAPYSQGPATSWGLRFTTSFFLSSTTVCRPPPRRTEEPLFTGARRPGWPLARLTATGREPAWVGTVTCRVRMMPPCWKRVRRAPPALIVKQAHRPVNNQFCLLFGRPRNTSRRRGRTNRALSRALGRR